MRTTVKAFTVLWTSLMITPLAALAAAAPPPPASDFRTVDPETALVIDTTKGRVIVEMLPEVAPQSVERVKALAREKFYDGLTFHRVVDEFMAQGGDPKGDGSGGSDKPPVPGEFLFRRGAETPFVQVAASSGLEDGFVKSLPVRTQSDGLMVMTADGKVQAWGLWCPGVAGMARSESPDSANSQYFLMRQFNGGLERKYTPWGRVLVGLDVVRALKAGEPVDGPDKMTSVRVLADLPAATRPKLAVLDTRSASFAARLEAAKAAHGGQADACEIDLPVRVN